MNAKFVETVQFITEVSERPALWDNSHHLYTDRKVCDAIWEDIGSQFCISGCAAKARWKNLRDNFRRELRKSPLGLSGKVPEDYNSTWRFFPHMFFLKDLLKGMPLNGNGDVLMEVCNRLSEKASTCSSSSGILMDDDRPEIEETTHDAFKREFPKPAKEVTEKVARERELLATPVRIKQEDHKLGEDSLEQQLAAAMLSTVDADVGFLASLLPHLRSFPDEQKARLKYHIMQVVVRHIQLHERNRELQAQREETASPPPPTKRRLSE